MLKKKSIMLNRKANDDYAKKEMKRLIALLANTGDLSKRITKLDMIG